MDVEFLSQEFEAAVATGIIDKDGYLAQPLRSFIHQSRYAYLLDDRYETWVETVQRFMTSILKILERDYDHVPSKATQREVYHAILNQEVMPSMRCMYSAGPALEKDCTYGYNCAFIKVDRLKRFKECLYGMMCGVGFGYSVQHCYVDRLPTVPMEILKRPDVVIKVADSREGWADAVGEFLEFMFQGIEPVLDYSDIRPAGSRLKTTGGQSQGPAPLQTYISAITEIIRSACGRKLSPLNAHDMMTTINSVVENGGGRRGALISIFDHDDEEMIHCKDFDQLKKRGNRVFANNSACYPEDMTRGQFDRLFDPLISAGSGEPGIFNLPAIRKAVAKQGKRHPRKIKGCNPCGEVWMDSEEFCNLCEIIVRYWDSRRTLREKARIAAIIGTWQSALTNFPYLGAKWEKHCKRNRLLGVSMSGLFDCEVTSPSNPDLPAVLAEMRDVTHRTNAMYAKLMGINASVAVTTVKPSGTVSLLTGVCYGVHPWHSPYFLRTIRIPTSDPICKLLKASGIRNEVKVDMAGKEDPATTVFFIPCKAPEGVVTSMTLTAQQHFEAWKLYKLHWTDHNPSVTINVKPDEWQGIKETVWENLDIVGGLSFFPVFKSFYPQLVVNECSKEVYEAEMKTYPTNVPYSDIWRYTGDDGDEENSVEQPAVSKSQEEIKTARRRNRLKERGATELACSGGVCATADIF